MSLEYPIDFIRCFDEYVDVEALKNLHNDICHGIVKSTQQITILNGAAQTLAIKEPEPFSSEISDYLDCLDTTQEKSEFLSLTKQNRGLMKAVMLKDRDTEFRHIQDSRFCKETENYENFPSLIKWIDQLPFKSYGRVVIFLNDVNTSTPVHQDVQGQDRRHPFEFIWCRTKLDKELFVHVREEKIYLQGHTGMFNIGNWHGCDPTPFPTFSIRIDGYFEDWFKERIKS